MALRITLIWSHGCFCACSGSVLHISNRSIAVLYKKPREYHKNYFLRSRRFVISERLVDLFLQGSAPRHRCTDNFTEYRGPSGSMAVTLKTQFFVFSGRGRRVVCRSEVPNPLHKERERERERTVKGSPNGGTPARKICSRDLEARMWNGGSRSRAATKDYMPPDVFSILHFRLAEFLDHWRVGSSICHFLIHILCLFSYWRLAVYEKGAKRNQRKPKGNPKGAKREPRKAKWSQKRAKGEQKGSQKGTRRRPKCITKSINERFRKVSPKSHQNGLTNWSFLKSFSIENQCKKQCKNRSRANEDKWWNVLKIDATTVGLLVVFFHKKWKFALVG